MYRPLSIDANTPPTVRDFIAQVCDLFLLDVHSMLRLPRPEVGITAGCNFTIAAALTNVISGISVTLFEPPADRRETGRKFVDLAAHFFPWDTEPPEGLRDPREASEILSRTFRNPMAHAFGLQDPEPVERVSITRFPGDGLSEASLEAIETSLQRPFEILRNAPTLRRVAATQRLELNAENFYWGVRELVRRLTADAARMAAAEAYLRPMVK
jgi:hypothetical protein